MSFLNKIFGDANAKYLKTVQPMIDKINSLEEQFERFSNFKLKQLTDQFKKRLSAGESLDDLLAEAFAAVREAAKRTLNQRHFDVQLIGGIVLHQGKIAEMKTGEGKTLAATLAIYLNALEGKGAHLVTVNDYLSRRDTVWMGQIYHLLGLSVGCLGHEQAFCYDPNYQKPDEEKDKIRDELGGFKIVEDFLKPVTRKEAYQADLTYGTNNEFGFDFLRDNLVYNLEDQVQRGHYFVLLDEVDSILIDEARTPLIISNPEEEATTKYREFARLMGTLQKDQDYQIEEKEKSASFTEAGQSKIIRRLGFDPWLANDILTTHQLEAALKARTLFQKDRDYVLKEGQVIIVDEFTGRLMPGRRWSGGLHQAVEAKEGVKVQQESRTLATVTFQNYFRRYQKLAGMTGTAATSSEEFDKVYSLEVVVVPTNQLMIREDLPDRVYKSEAGKFDAIVEEIKEKHKRGQPVLIGTRSIEKNEYLGSRLKRANIPHQILNAKEHEREGEIIAQAGKLGAVTLATNMAGRGVDIVLGGSPQNESEYQKIKALGGFYVIGTERHEARRIDNQLRGRTGRQGDPGSSQFFLSLEDELLRVFGGERIGNLMEKFNLPENQPIQANLVSKAVESAQAKIEGLHFDLRKNVLEFDEVDARQRDATYRKRREILSAPAEELREMILAIFEKRGRQRKDYQEQEKEIGQEKMRELGKMLFLRSLDFHWLLHLEDLAQLKEAVRLRAYGQKNPLIEYKIESRALFEEMMDEVENSLIKGLEKVSQTLEVRGGKPAVLARASRDKVGRNDPCPCGAKKPDGHPIKYKRCHGA